MVLLELTPNWDERQSTVDREDLHSRWLEHYPRHAAPDGRTSRSKQKARSKASDGLKRLEKMGVIRRGVGFVLLMNLPGLRDVALKLPGLEDDCGRAKPTLTVIRAAPRQDGCPSGKVPFRSEREALLTLLRMWQQAGQEGNPLRRERRTYHCERCAYWHLTSQARDDRQ
jgi:hypothetical protein